MKGCIGKNLRCGLAITVQLAISTAGSTQGINLTGAVATRVPGAVWNTTKEKVKQPRRKRQSEKERKEKRGPDSG